MQPAQLQHVVLRRVRLQVPGRQVQGVRQAGRRLLLQRQQLLPGGGGARAHMHAAKELPAQRALRAHLPAQQPPAAGLRPWKASGGSDACDP